MVFVFPEHIDGQEWEMGEWLSAQLEGTVDVPALCSGQKLELLISGEYQMTTAMQLTSVEKKPSGMWSSSNLKSRSSWSFGRSCWRFLLAAQAIYSGLGELEQGPLVIWSSRTSFTMAEAGLKISAAALVLTEAVIAADIAAPGSAWWLWALTDNWKLLSLQIGRAHV